MDVFETRMIDTTITEETLDPQDWEGVRYQGYRILDDLLMKSEMRCLASSLPAAATKGCLLTRDNLPVRACPLHH
jgi:hypothetical protein